MNILVCSPLWQYILIHWILPPSRISVRDDRPGLKA